MTLVAFSFAAILLQPGNLGGADVVGVDAAVGADDLREPHRPRAETGADVGHRHPRLQLQQLGELRELELRLLDLGIGQRRLLGVSGNGGEQRTGNEGNDTVHEASWAPAV